MVQSSCHAPCDFQIEITLPSPELIKSTLQKHLGIKLVLARMISAGATEPQ